MVEKEFSYNFYENGEHELIKKLSKFKFKTLFDVGCNLGEWASIAESFFPDSDIHTFEISPSSFENSTKRLVKKNFHLNNFGLADKNEEINYKDYGINSQLNTIITNCTFHDSKIPHNVAKGFVKTGDEYCKTKNIKYIDFLKIDTEGAEHLVLKGFSDLLSKQSIRLIQFEYGYANGDAKFLMKDFFDFFRKFGYSVAKLRKKILFTEWSYEYNDFKSGPNYIAIKKNDHEIVSSITS